MEILKLLFMFGICCILWFFQFYTMMKEHVLGSGILKSIVITSYLVISVLVLIKSGSFISASHNIIADIIFGMHAGLFSLLWLRADYHLLGDPLLTALYHVAIIVVSIGMTIAPESNFIADRVIDFVIIMCSVGLSYILMHKYLERITPFKPTSTGTNNTKIYRDSEIVEILNALKITMNIYICMMCALLIIYISKWLFF